MGQASCPDHIEAGEKDSALRVRKTRSGLLSPPVLFFAALHAAAPFSPGARVQASVLLRASRGGAGNQRALQLTEGNAAFLAVRATGLSRAAQLEVLIEAGLPEDVNFASSAALTAAESSTRVEAAVSEDGGG